MDVAFSGILSTIAESVECSPAKKEDVCFSLQEISFSMLLEITERALAHFESSEVLIVGGVGCNHINSLLLGNLRLQEMVSTMIRDRGGKLFAMNDNYCIDNGAMIAFTGSLYYSIGITVNIRESNCLQRFNNHTP
jgi:N6-L-threonylcarbamoyladenine synthase